MGVSNNQWFRIVWTTPTSSWSPSPRSAPHPPNCPWPNRPRRRSAGAPSAAQMHCRPGRWAASQALEYVSCWSLIILYLCLYLYLSLYIYLYISIYLYIYLYIYISIYLSIYRYIYISVYLCIYIYISLLIYITINIHEFVGSCTALCANVNH